MSFALYIVGYVILIIGLALGAYYLHVEPRWIGVGVLVMIGLGIATGVSRTRQKDPAS
jgi:predicted signal transduction protein with EAL and GGDEF domain